MNKQKILLILLTLVFACLMFADPPQWTPMIGNQYNMQVYAEVFLFDQPFNEDNPENILAAFGPGGDDDCRAIAVWDQVGPYAMWYLTVRSNAEATAQEVISFKIYDAASDMIHDCEGEYIIYFADNSVAGSLYEPYQLFAPADLPPVSIPDAYSTPEDELLEIDSINGVLSNDYDPDGLPLTAMLIDSTQNGQLEFFNDGSFYYLPNQDFFGSDQFTYQAFDGELYGDITQVDITIEPVNDPPVFQFPPEGFDFDEDTDLIVDFSLYISDPEGDEIDQLNASASDYLNIEIVGLVVQFSAEENWFGSEIITFQAIDEFGASETQDVIITVNPVNDSPVIEIPFDQFTMQEDEEQILDLSQYISDIDNQELTLAVFDNDNIEVVVDGYSVTLSPQFNWYGSEVLNFVVSDEMNRLTDNDFVEIIVEPVNDDPVINIPQDEYSFNEDENLILDLSDYIYDVDDLELQITYSGNDNLILTNISPAVFNITAPQNWFGFELITFTVSDPAGLTDSDQVTINVIPVQDPPVIVLPDNFTLDEDSSLMVDFEAQGYVFDVDSDSLYLMAQGVNIQVNINGLLVEFVPLPDWNGSEMISFTVYDETLMDVDDVEVVVNPVNDPPTMDIEDSYTFHEDQSLQVDFSQYITDIDQDEITLTVEGNQNILVDIDQLMVTFTSLPDWFGSEILIFTANDNQGRAIATDSTEVIVLPANDPPQIDLPPTIAMNEDVALQLDFADYITDDSDSLWLSVQGNVNISVNIDQLIVTFTPEYNWNGFEIMTFSVFDGEYSASDDVTVSVIPVNDPPQINLPVEFVFSPNMQYNINFNNYVFDHDGDELSLTYSGNQNIDIDIDGLMVTFSTSDWLGVETVRFTVDDGYIRDTAYDDVDIVVTDDTQMPVIYLPDSFSFNEDGSLNVDFDQYIFNDTSVEVYLSAEGNQNVFVQIDSLTNQVVFSALANWFGSEEISFTIYAPGYDYYSSDVTTVIVNPVNDPPVINLPVEGFSFLEDSYLNVNFNLGYGYISDVDSDSVYISLNNNNPDPNIYVSLVDGIATFSAPPDWNGAEDFTISVNDGAIYLEEVFTVNVIPVNDAPSIELPELGFTFPENSTLPVDFSQYISDVDLQELIINQVNESDYVFTQITGSLVTFSALDYWNGSEAIVFSVNDLQGRAIDIDTVMVYVTPVNNAPYVQNPIPDLEIWENSYDVSVNLNNVFDDYDTDPSLNEVINDSLIFSYAEPGEDNFNISIENGQVTIAPVQNWFGVKTLFFFATDTGGLTAVDSTAVTVVSVNYPPVVIENIPDFSKLEDFADFTIDLDQVFYDQDGDVLDYTVQYDQAQIITQIDGSILTISSLENWFGLAGIIVFATDPDSLAASDGFVVNVTPVNDPPEIELPDQFNLTEDVIFTSDFSNYACDCDGDDIYIFNDVTQNLNITYNDSIPLEVYIIGDPNWNGSEMVTFYVSDQTGRLLDSDSVLVNVAPVNDPPQIDVPGAGFTFLEDNELTVDFTPYISDIDSENLTIIVSDGDYVQAVINGYQVTFSANENWFGTEQITFTVGDDEFYVSDIAPVIVTPVNDDPVINLPAAFNTQEDVSLPVDFTEYITDIDNPIGEITISLIGNYPDVDVDINNMMVTFTPDPDFYGTVNIGFLIDDGDGGTDSDYADLIIASVNDAPSIELPDSFSFDEDENLVVDFEPYINDIDGDDLTLSSVNPDNITIFFNEYIVTFTAAVNWNGTESVTFIVSDDRGRAMDSDDVDVIVIPVNDAPVINLPPEFRFNEDNTHERNFLTYISDIDTPIDELALQCSGYTNIIVDIVDFDVTISALENWNGSETLTFTVYETTMRLQDSDDVLVTVRPVNDPPVIVLPNSVNVNEGGSLLLDMTDFVEDVDNDFSELIITSVGTDHLDVEIDGFDVTIIAFSDWNGTEVIEFTVDDQEYSVSDNMRVNILPVNDPPDINLPDQFSTNEDIPLSVDFSEFVFDVDQDQISLTVSGNENIQVFIDGLAVTLLGLPNWFGEEVLHFTADDNVTRLTDTDSVLVVINPVNDAPVINLPASIIAIQDSLETFDFTEYINDVDDDSLTLSYEGNDFIDNFVIDGLTVTIEDNTWMISENVLFSVSDGHLTDSDVVNFTLIPSGEIPSPTDVVITLPNIDGLEPGEEFELPVNVNILLEGWDVTGFDFILIYNPEILEFLGWNLENTIIDTTRSVARDDFIIFDQDDPIFGSGTLINIEFKYISTEYEQDVVELDEFEFHAPTPFFPIVFDGVVNNDFPTLAIPLADQTLQEDFATVSIDLENFFYDNTPQSDLEFSVSSASQDFAVTIDQNMMNLVSIPDQFTNQTWPVTVVCWDRFLYSVRDTFFVFVNPVNDAPVINIYEDFQVATDQQLQVDFNNYITDVDNDVESEVTIDISYGDAPGEEDFQLIPFSFDEIAKTATFSGPHNWTGENIFNIVAYDPADSSTAVFTVNVIYLGSNDVHCYPNPMSTEFGTNFVINSVTPLAEISIDIYNFAGKQVCSRTFQARGGNEINWMGYTEGWNGSSTGTKLARGVYFARIVAKDDFGETALEKVVKVAIKE